MSVHYLPSFSVILEHEAARGQPAQPVDSGALPSFESLPDKAMSMPNTKKPPGGSRKMMIGSIKPESTGSPKTVPAPKSSRIMPIASMAAVKPTPSIGRPQKTVRLSAMEAAELTVHGRHDPCVAHRAVPVAEAVTAAVLLDMLLEGNHGTF